MRSKKVMLVLLLLSLGFPGVSVSKDLEVFFPEGLVKIGRGVTQTAEGAVPQAVLKMFERNKNYQVIALDPVSFKEKNFPVVVVVEKHSWLPSREFSDTHAKKLIKDVKVLVEKDGNVFVKGDTILSPKLKVSYSVQDAPKTKTRFFNYHFLMDGKYCLITSAVRKTLLPTHEKAVENAMLRMIEAYEKD